MQQTSEGTRAENHPPAPAPERLTLVAGAARGPVAGSDTADTLRSLADAALRRIDSMPGASRTQARYGRPWYLFAGEPDEIRALLLAGQTAGTDAPPPTGPRSWSWWLLPKLVGIAMGEGLVCGPSRDKDGWQALETALGLLHQYRPKLPLNGIIAVVSAGSLGRPERVEALAADLRAVVGEAYKSLRPDFPVSIVVTGLERLPGFSGYFGALPATVRTQALGHINDPPLSSDNPEPQLRQVFADIADRLERIRLGALQDLSREIDRSGVFMFPEALASLEDGLAAFCRILCGVHSYGHPISWRGLFLAAPQAPAGDARFCRDLLERFLPFDAGLIQPR